jgi:hypothetical protein
VEHLKGASLQHVPALIGWKKLARDKRSSLLQKFVTYSHRKFFNIGLFSPKLDKNVRLGYRFFFQNQLKVGF